MKVPNVIHLVTLNEDGPNGPPYVAHFYPSWVEVWIGTRNNSKRYRMDEVTRVDTSGSVEDRSKIREEAKQNSFGDFEDHWAMAYLPE